jgi:hypothetical protein
MAVNMITNESDISKAKRISKRKSGRGIISITIAATI